MSRMNLRTRGPNSIAVRMDRRRWADTAGGRAAAAGTRLFQVLMRSNSRATDITAVKSESTVPSSLKSYHGEPASCLYRQRRRSPEASSREEIQSSSLAESAAGGVGTAAYDGR